MNWFHKHKKKIILATVGFFIIGSFAGFGRDLFLGSPVDAAIVVEDQKIPRKRFDQFYQQVLQERQAGGSPATAPEQEWLKRQVVQALVQEAIFTREAEKFGILVSDLELQHFIQSVPAFQKDGRFDPAVYQQTLNRVRLTVPQFETDQRRQLRTQKTQYVMASGVHISSLELPRRMQERLAKIDQVLKAGAAGLGKFPEENQEQKPAADVLKQLQAERGDIMNNPQGFRDRLRNEEVRLSLQEWYTALNTQLKIKVNIDKPEA